MRKGRCGAQAVIAWLIATATVGCGVGERPVPPTVTIEDSSGVRVVRIPPLEQFSLPEIDAERLYSTQDVGRGGLELFRVRDALFLMDGTLVIANGGTDELFFIGPEGVSVRAVGRKGRGPGEFNGLSRLIPESEGGFLAWDFRLSRFDKHGAFVGTERLNPESRVVSLEPLAVYGDGRIVAVLGQQNYFQRNGERRDTVPLMVFPSGQDAPDTIGTWKGLERAFGELRGQATFIVPIGFARTVFFGANGERVAIGSSDSLDLTVFDSALKVTLRLVARSSKRHPTDAQEKAWRDFISGRMSLNDDDVRRAWAEGPIRETLPGFDGLAVDSEGRLWIAEATVPGSARRRWVVFDADGTPVGEWKVRATWHSYLPGRTELLAVGSDRVALLRRTEFDEESVEVWQIHWRE